MIMIFYPLLPLRILLNGMLAILFIGAVAEAQTTNWSAPASGYVQDSLSRSVRPITGILGSATLGSAVVSNTDWVSLAPNQKSGLVQQNGALVYIPDLAFAANAQTLDRVPPARQSFWSSDSTSAVIITQSDRLIWLNFGSTDTGLPGGSSEWHLQGLAPLTSRGAAARWLVLAADPAANKVLLTAGNGSGSQLWMASRTAPPAPLAYTGHAVAAVFAANSPVAFLADTAAHQIVRLETLDTAPSFSSVFRSELYVDDPAALALSVDDTQLFIADKKTTFIRAFDSRTGVLTNEILADFEPFSLTRLAPSRFLLNIAGTAARPLLFLETSVPARVLFVPRVN